MKIKLTKAHLESQPAISSILLAKLVDKVEWDSGDFTKAQIQYCLNNDIKMDDMVLYSPVLTDAQINSQVPKAWPNSEVLDEEGNVVRRYKLNEYLRSTAVTGGVVLQFAGGKMDDNGNITLPTNSQLRAQVALAGGFMTQEEVDAIKIIEETNE